MRSVVLSVLLLAFARDAYACSCSFAKTLAANMRIHDAVFTATIVSKRAVLFQLRQPAEAGIEATAQVGRVWKGKLPATVHIRTGLGMGDCGVHFERGATYLVFAGEHKGRY